MDEHELGARIDRSMLAQLVPTALEPYWDFLFNVDARRDEEPPADPAAQERAEMFERACEIRAWLVHVALRRPEVVHPVLVCVQVIDAFAVQMFWRLRRPHGRVDALPRGVVELHFHELDAYVRRVGASDKAFEWDVRGLQQTNLGRLGHLWAKAWPRVRLEGDLG